MLPLDPGVRLALQLAAEPERAALPAGAVDGRCHAERSPTVGQSVLLSQERDENSLRTP